MALETMPKMHGTGPQVVGDDKFRRRMRLHQSWYRDQILEAPYGVGPTSKSKTYFGSMLAKEPAEKGRNFLTHRIFQVAKKRLEFRSKAGTVDPFRLKRNMLSSQPMCFNLFGELTLDHHLATKLACALWDERVERIAEVSRICIEWAPKPAAEYLNDRTAFDALIEYSMKDGGKGFIGIETKLSEPLSPKIYDKQEYRRWMQREDSPWRADAINKVTDKKHNQLWRGHLLTWSLLQHPKSEYKEGNFTILHHPSDSRCKKAIQGYRELLREEETFLSFDLAEVCRRWEPFAGEWLAEFERRYLALELSKDAKA